MLPWLLDRAMRVPALMNARAKTVREVEGRVLEVGFGSGTSLQFYRSSVGRLTTLDPSKELWNRAQHDVDRAALAVDGCHGSAEALPFGNDTFDGVVSIMTLCSISDVDGALAEVQRVLRPGGRFAFLEHGLGPSERLQRWQRRITPLQKGLAGGCHIDRRIDELIQQHQLQVVTLDRYVMAGLTALDGSMYQGVAVKAPARV
ncbi:MAG: class I SAM-dependent methyltransferase [Herpetosiphon sp.]